jgi:hypothetical protein
VASERNRDRRTDGDFCSRAGEKEHKKIPTQKGSYNGTPRDLVAKDVRDLRNHTKAPNSALQKLVKFIKNTFPEVMKKL